MQFSERWLREWVDPDIDTGTLCEQLTGAGLEVDGVADAAASFKGVVVGEVVFAVPGLGRLLSDAIKARDYPIIQGLILVLSAIYILVNLAVDVVYAYLDPRIRY